MNKFSFKNKKLLVSLLIICLAIVGFAGYKFALSSKQVQGTKEYTLTVRDTENTFNKKYEFKTEETSLGKDLDNRGIIKTDNSGTSRFVTGVDGKDADVSKKEWWNLKINGEDSQTGVDDTMINNGDNIEFILTTGW